LRLRRREQSDENPLHQKIVAWVGGHVRREDATSGKPLDHCAMRELNEELRLNIESKDLRLLGAVYIDGQQRTSQHVAIVYEWRATTDDVAIALSSAEFFERRGTSLSGSFVDLNVLAADVESGKIQELWTQEIVRELLARDFGFNPRLFN
jgi:ADP-ribose pyrophosphatase YjhB (NUDIX family)